jgi:hypothetical protein
LALIGALAFHDLADENECIAMLVEMTKLAAEINQFERERDQLIQLRDYLIKQRNEIAAERDKLLERLAANAHYDEKILVENLRLRAALEIIAGKRQCVDNLLSNVEIARRALEGE